MDTDFEGSDLRPFFFDFTWDQCGKVTEIAVFTPLKMSISFMHPINVVKTRKSLPTPFMNLDFQRLSEISTEVH